MGDVWFTSDLHIGHKKVAALRMGHEQVPDFWTDHETNRHDEILAEKWDAAISADDHVWVLGDISSGSGTGQRYALEWLNARPGVKHLIAGNHDGVHPLNRDAWKWMPTYLTAFTSVQSAARRYVF